MWTWTVNYGRGYFFDPICPVIAVLIHHLPSLKIAMRAKLTGHNKKQPSMTGFLAKAALLVYQLSSLNLAVRWIAVTNRNIIVCICCWLDASSIECSDWLRWSTVICLDRLLHLTGQHIAQDSPYQRHSCMINYQGDLLQKVYVHRPVFVVLRCHANDTFWGIFMPAASRDMQDDRTSQMNN